MDSIRLIMSILSAVLRVVRGVVSRMAVRSVIGTGLRSSIKIGDFTFVSASLTSCSKEEIVYARTQTNYFTTLKAIFVNPVLKTVHVQKMAV